MKVLNNIELGWGGVVALKHHLWDSGMGVSTSQTLKHEFPTPSVFLPFFLSHFH